MSWTKRQHSFARVQPTNSDFRNLVVWQRAHQLVLDVYRMTRLFPSDERFGLTAQVRRSAASIATNLAEGRSRHSRASYAAFTDIALGSAGETDYQLLLARDLEYLHPLEYEPVAEEVHEIRRMLAKLHRYLQAPY